jgi:hypothetical protein
MTRVVIDGAAVICGRTVIYELNVMYEAPAAAGCASQDMLHSRAGLMFLQKRPSVRPQMTSRQ